MDIHVLMIDDEEKVTEAVTKILHNETIGGHKIVLETVNNFDDGKEKLRSFDYDLLILDIFRGKASEGNPARDGDVILEDIKTHTFIPIIFFSGLTKYVEGLESDIIRIVTKTAGGNEALIKEIGYIINTDIPLIKKRLNNHIKECMRSYFWEFIQQDWSELSDSKDNISIGYLLARRIAKSFSKSNVKNILNDRKLSEEKIYPLEYYIFPINDDSLEMGDILSNDGRTFIVITPSCDFHQKKSDYVHLAGCIPLSEFDEYKKFKNNASTPNRESLSRIIKSSKKDRFYFLPKTHFIDNLVIDFQQILSVEISNIKEFDRVAKLDSPFAQSMLGYFIRNYNRIGTEDLDEEYIINNL